MEVHHHPHVEHKSFKAYLLEGLMIFIAVMMGFIAENIREYIHDKSIAKEYVLSLKQDLKLDTANLARSILLLHEKATQLDSLIILMSSKNRSIADINKMYYYARWATRKTSFYSTDRTLAELKNSGSFRLVTNEYLIDNIMDYEQEVNIYNINDANDLQERSLLYPFISRVFDAGIFQKMVNNDDGLITIPAGKNILRNTDKDYLNQFAYYVHQLKSSFIVERKTLENLKVKATLIIEEISDAYN